jgi:membrane protein
MSRPTAVAGIPRDEREGLLRLRRIWVVAVNALRAARSNAIGDAAAAITYYGFTALPAVLVSSLGLVLLIGGRDAVDAFARRAARVLPPDAVTLMHESLTRAAGDQRGGVFFFAVGLLLALWSTTSALTALMRGLNRACGVKETRGFVTTRLTALAMLAFVVLGFTLTFGLIALGPVLSGWLGEAVGSESLVQALWWSVQWPIAFVGLLLAAGGLLYFGPNVGSRRWQLASAGAVVATLCWLVASLLFAVYVSRFGSYNKAWGSLTAVIVTIVWMWLSVMALLFGAEVDCELERARTGGHRRDGNAGRSGIDQ